MTLPTWSRRKKRKTIRLTEGATVELIKVPPRRAYRMKGPIARELGPLFVALAGGVEDAEGNKIPMSVIASNEVYLGEFIQAVIKHLEGSSEDALILLLAELIEGCATFRMADIEVPFEGTPEEVAALFDRCFADVHELLRFGWEALDFQVGFSTLAKGMRPSLASASAGPSNMQT